MGGFVCVNNKIGFKKENNFEKSLHRGASLGLVPIYHHVSKNPLGRFFFFHYQNLL